MNREIKFRGKDPKGGWVEGYYLQDLTQGEMRSYIFNCPCYWEVLPETVGQFTGLLDKNGKEIFEGDIIEWHQELIDIDKDGELVSDFVDWRGEVEYFHAAYFVEGVILDADLEGNRCNAEVVGNIHDNPELLKTETL